MGNLIRSANSFAKSFLLASRIGYLFLPISGALRFASNFALLTRWVMKRKGAVPFNDFYRPARKYNLRIDLYNHILQMESLAERPIMYLEYGVAAATSFKWWLAHNANADSRFYGFDTFEGLPENWAFYKKGAMSYAPPNIDDNRALFYKGLFQETLFPFLKEADFDKDVRRVIHMDADLYSSTLFVLSSLARYLRVGDLIFFDEFNVPNHEFAAWNDFTRSFYVEYEVLGAVNNFYQTCFRITKLPFGGAVAETAD